MSPSSSSRGCFSARGQTATSPQLQPPAHFLPLWEDIAQWPGAVRTRSLLHVQPCPVSKDQLGQVLKEGPISLCPCGPWWWWFFRDGVGLLSCRRCYWHLVWGWGSGGRMVNFLKV